MARMHKPPHELRQMLERIQQESHSSSEVHRRIEKLRELVELCPTFVPAILALSRGLLLNTTEVNDPQTYFAEIEHLLRGAEEVSGKDASALIELAHFIDVVRDAPSVAEAMFAQASQRALKLLEESWAGQISALGQQNKLDAALAIAKQAARILPHSTLIQEAVEFARQCASG
jgi:hypothetical protein